MTGQAVQPGQVWVPKLGSHIHASLRVTRVDKASVWTDHGRTTVFALRRRYRLQEASP